MPFLALSALIVTAFVFGGGSRADIQSLVILRPIAVLLCGFALLTIRPEHIRAYGALVGIMAAAMVIAVVHVVPLPPGIWQSLPGREVIARIDAAAGLGDVWRPIGMVPAGAWNALYSLSVPVAALLLGIQLPRQRLFDLLPLLLALGLASGLIGLLQILGDPHGPLYFYRVTNEGTAVGLFANRNHQAVLIATLFPMLAVYAGLNKESGRRSVRPASDRQLRMRTWLSFAAGCLLVPLLLVTGSRAGLVTGVIGVALAFVIYRKRSNAFPQAAKGLAFIRRWRFALIGFGVAALAGLTVFLSRAEALRRLVASDTSEELRFRVWGPIVETAWRYFPVGSGTGSFIEVYQITERDEFLAPQYLNRAHNDVLEIFVTAGLPGMILLVAAVAIVVRPTMVAFFAKQRRPSTNLDFAKLGASILAILVLGSIADYPVRVPSISCVLVVACLWLFAGARQGGGRAEESDALGYPAVAGRQQD